MDTSTYQVYVDRNRHTYLMFRDNGKTRQYVSMLSGQIEIVQLSQKDFKDLILRTDTTPQQFAEVYLKSTQEISRSARAILRVVLGGLEEKSSTQEAPRFSSATVSLQEICENYRWNPSRVRKHLRKLMNKPGGRWVFTQDEAQKIINMVKECLPPGTISNEQ